MSADTINLRLYDYDGVIEAPIISEGNVIHCHPTFFSNELLDITKNKYQTIIIGSFTGRGSLLVDNQNCYGNNTYSCLPSFAQIQSYFDEHLSSGYDSQNVKVQIDPLMMADLYDRREGAYAGRAYEEGLKFFAEQANYKTATSENYFSYHARGRSKAHDHTHVVFDEKKFTMLYAHLHRIAKQFPDQDIVVDVFDDREDILRYLHHNFSKFPHFAPKNVHVNLHQIKEDIVVKNYSFQGSGEIDEHYDWTINNLAYQYGSSSKTETLEGFFKQPIRERSKINIKSLFRDGTDEEVRLECLMDGYPLYFHTDLTKFINTHEGESNPNIVNARYITAQELIENKLMKIEHFQLDKYQIAINQIEQMINQQIKSSNFQFGWAGSNFTITSPGNFSNPKKNIKPVPQTIFQILKKLEDYNKLPLKERNKQLFCEQIANLLENALVIKQDSKTNKFKNFFGCGRAQSTTEFYQDLLALIPNHALQQRQRLSL